MLLSPTDKVRSIAKDSCSSLTKPGIRVLHHQQHACSDLLLYTTVPSAQFQVHSQEKPVMHCLLHAKTCMLHAKTGPHTDSYSGLCIHLVRPRHRQKVDQCKNEINCEAQQATCCLLSQPGIADLSAIMQPQACQTAVTTIATSTHCHDHAPHPVDTFKRLTMRWLVAGKPIRA